MQQQHAPGQAGSIRRNQVVVGLMLPHEQFPLPKLLEFGVQAEQAGFAAVWASDHFEPWQDNLGHSGLAWVTLAALGQRTQRLLLGTGVTCPSYRYRPPIVAQAFASLGLLYLVNALPSEQI
jgi:F420-dependent hydroxymycolic acid dehydrogenase